MKNNERVLVRSVARYAAEHGLALRRCCHDWLLEIAGAGKTHYIFGYDLGLNRSSVARILNDKAATSELLEAKGLATVPHRLFLHPRLLAHVDAGPTWPRLEAVFEAFASDVVVKDNEGTAGNGIARARSLEALELATTALFAKERSVAIAPFVEIEWEVRFILLGEQCLYAYAKVPASGEWRHNLGRGARPEPINWSARHWRPGLALAQRTLDALGARFAAVDIVWVDGRAHVLEVNAGVMLEHLCRALPDGPAIADRIYHQALDEAFADAQP